MAYLRKSRMYFRSHFEFLDILLIFDTFPASIKTYAGNSEYCRNFKENHLNLLSSTSRKWTQYKTHKRLFPNYLYCIFYQKASVPAMHKRHISDFFYPFWGKLAPFDVAQDKFVFSSVPLQFVSDLVFSASDFRPMAGNWLCFFKQGKTTKNTKIHEEI